MIVALAGSKVSGRALLTAVSASRPPSTLARMCAKPSMLTCNAVPSRRFVSDVALADPSIPRASSDSTVASQAGVAGMSDLVAAMECDDPARQIVKACLFETCFIQHVQQRLLVGMHANRFGKIPVARSVIGDEAPQQWQNFE